MKSLIVDDDPTCRVLLGKILKGYGEMRFAVNGKEAVEAAGFALEAGKPFDLICLDIMMPEMDGNEALLQIREQEKSKGIELKDGVKIIMTSALDDMSTVTSSYKNLCDFYIVKPIRKENLVEMLQKLKLVE